ncbi:MAG TPA: hypothetical protein ENO25_05540 [Desulfobacteraceae bacterium]|nr:hypothetical protein [Desulfobacteraceae bacterium]
MNISQQPTCVTIRGIVIPAEWDGKGNAVAVAISTFDEEEYLVEHDHTGIQLLSNMHVKVEARGTVIQAEGKKRIKIQHYSLAEPWGQQTAG